MILGLAPMDGITDCAYRSIVQNIFYKYNNFDNIDLFLWTEFMNADGYLINPQKLIRHILTNKSQKNVILQIYGGNEETLIKSAVELEEKYSNYFYGIELNIGCPSPKVMACGGGSGMMIEKDKTLKIIQNICKNISMPFSIKTRTGINEKDTQNQFDFLNSVSQYCNMITIHGRTFKQSHSGEVDRDFIYKLKKNIKNKKCKIIGNGGIESFDDAIKKIENLDGIMIGQNAVGNPRIFSNYKPNYHEIKSTIIEHLNLMIACEMYFKDFSNMEILQMPTNEILKEYIQNFKKENLQNIYSIVEFRKFLFNYVKGIPNSKEFKIQISQTKDYYVIVELVNKFFTQI